MSIAAKTLHGRSEDLQTDTLRKSGPKKADGIQQFRESKYNVADLLMLHNDEETFHISRKVARCLGSSLKSFYFCEKFLLVVVKSFQSGAH